MFSPTRVSANSHIITSFLLSHRILTITSNTKLLSQQNSSSFTILCKIKENYLLFDSKLLLLENRCLTFKSVFMREKKEGQNSRSARIGFA